jgi:hypothetical protein
MTTKTGVIYLQKDKFQLYSPFLRQIVEFKFTPQMVLDLDVLNGDLLKEQIKVFVTNGKIPPSSMIIVLCDNAYFLKDFSMQAPPAQPSKPGQPAAAPATVSMADLKPQIDLFVEHVPYENVVSQTFPLKNGLRVCAVNQDFYKTIQRGFEQLGFTFESVLPGMVLGGGISAKPVLDGVLANTALQKYPALKQFNLITQAPFTPSGKKVEAETVDEVQEAIETNKEPAKTDKKRLAVMLGAMGVLLIVLVIVLMQSMQPLPEPAPSTPSLAQQPTAVQPMATATAIEESPETISTAQMQNLTVQIISSSETATAAQALRTALNTYKFRSISSQTQNSVSSATTVVSFSGETSQSVRNAVLNEIRKVKTEVTVQESQSSANDITIVVGK